MAVEKKSLLLLMRHAPYGSSLARTGIDMALAAAAFEQNVSVLFTGDGILQLLPEQDAQLVGAKNLGRIIASMPLYGIETFYVDTASAAQRGIGPSDLPEQALMLDSDALQTLLHGHHHVINF